MRRTFAASLLAIALPALASAQGLGDMAVIAAPHLSTYSIGSGASKQTITQTAVPLVFVIPVSSRFSMDITTAYASSQVKNATTTLSEITGLTDTQIRGNFSLGDRMLVFTAGINLPTGQYSIPEDQQAAAGQIGNDFLNYPISSMGNGLAGTGGVAFAKAVGSWNLGAGASFRKSTDFAAFTVSSAEYRFTPADEIRLNLGLDRPVGEGQVQFGLMYSAFGEDIADSTSYSTGDRLIASGGWSFPVRSSTVFLSGWNLYRMPGQQFGGAAPKENVANLNAGVSLNAGPVLIQPNVEMRLWQVDGIKAGNLLNTGVRLRLEAGSFNFFPAVGISTGNLYDIGTGAATKVSGLRSSLTIRWN